MSEDDIIKIDFEDDEIPEEDDGLVVIDYTETDEEGKMDVTLHSFELTAHMNDITIPEGFENILFQFVIHPTFDELDKVTIAIVRMIKDKFGDERAEFLKSITEFIFEQLLDMGICDTKTEAQERTDHLSFKLTIEVNKALTVLDNAKLTSQDVNEIT